MQTAIDFLVEKLNKLETEKHLYKIIDYRIKKQSIVDEAKEMERQKIIDAYEQGSDDEIFAYDGTRKYKNGVEYYTSTYGSKGSETKQ